MNNMYRICSSCGRKIKHSETCICRKQYLAKKVKEKDDGFYSSKRWIKLRKQVLKRDNHMCQRCMIKFDLIETEHLQAHHIKSREHYPELEMDINNIICVCRTCNLQLGTSDKLDFDWALQEEEKEYNL